MRRKVDLSEEETRMFCFVAKYPNLEVDTLAGRGGLHGIYINEVPILIESLERKQLIVCHETQKLDVANAWKYQMRGQPPYKSEKSCHASPLGQSMFKELCSKPSL